MSAAGTFAVSVPRLRTARLFLREPRLEDFEPFAANLADAEARKYIGGPVDRREAWRRFMSLAGTWLLQGKGWWCIEVPEAGCVGTVGVFRRETGPELEIGWSVDRLHWGKGYASEAAKAALDHAIASLGDRVIAFVSVDNPRSSAVALRIGMRLEAQVDFYDAPHLRYAFER
jgi:RimJ/RimL family protein N-acetyltransferase